MKHFKHRLTVYAHFISDSVQMGEPLMGRNIVDVIDLTFKCKTANSMDKWTKTNKITIDFCMGAICRN